MFISFYHRDNLNLNFFQFGVDPQDYEALADQLLEGSATPRKRLRRYRGRKTSGSTNVGLDKLLLKMLGKFSGDPNKALCATLAYIAGEYKQNEGKSLLSGEEKLVAIEFKFAKVITNVQ